MLQARRHYLSTFFTETRGQTLQKQAPGMKRPDPHPPYRLRVSLLYGQPQPLVDAALAETLISQLDDLSLNVTLRRSDGKTRLRLQTLGPDIRVLGSSGRLAERAFDRRKHALDAIPADPKAERRRELHRHHVTLEISERAGRRGKLLTPPQQVALAHRLVRAVAALAPADLVYWHRSAALQRIEDFLGDSARQSPARRRELLPEIVDDTPDGGEAVFDQLEIRMPADRIAEAEVMASRTPVRMTDGNRALRALFDAVPGPRPRRGEPVPEPHPDATLAERLSVLVLNVTVMVLAFPVGMGLLMYNILKGEDLRVTVRILSLTGTGMGLLAYTEVEKFLPFV